jgi:uncharacterized membrane protein
MWWQNRRRFQRDRIARAIQLAEAETSGEIVVSLAPFFWGNLERTAKRAFDRLGVSRTRQRNGILIFVVPSRRRFMVLGDEGIHQHVGPDFWTRLASILSDHFRRGAFTEGLEAAIAEAGQQLAHHFPHQPGDVNELPDQPA